jgi:signal transduction histidine kinase
LEGDLNENLPEAWFDPEGMHRCLTNLVTNAIDACADVTCSEKNGRVVLRSFVPEDARYPVGYEVVDNGCGIPDEMMPKVFQSFFSTKGTKGTGLGLMITKKIVDEHGGDIEVHSAPESGTRFIVRFGATEAPATTDGV